MGFNSGFKGLKRYDYYRLVSAEQRKCKSYFETPCTAYGSKFSSELEFDFQLIQVNE